MYRTDKVEHGYIPFYEKECTMLKHLARAGGRRPTILELGVRDGASMQMWRQMIPEAIVIGVDNSAGANMTVEGTEFIFSDQADPRLPERALEVYRKYYERRDGEPFVDLLVDDASHDGRATRESFMYLWPLVVPGGLYVIEDWYVGGPEWPSYDRSMLDLAEQLVSLTLDRDGPAESIEYRYGLIALRRAR